MFPDPRELEVDPCTVSDIEFWLEGSRIAGIIFYLKKFYLEKFVSRRAAPDTEPECEAGL